VNEGVNISPRGQILPLEAKLTLYCQKLATLGQLIYNELGSISTEKNISDDATWPGSPPQVSGSILMPEQGGHWLPCTLVAIFFSRRLLWSKKTGHENFYFFPSYKKGSA
jgi:hypothetical protein